MTKMTQKEYHQAIVDGNITPDVQAKAQEFLDKLNARSGKRAEENEPIKAEIMVFMGEVRKATAKEVADHLGVSTQKAGALLGQLVKANELVKLEKDKKSDPITYGVAE